MIKKIRYFKSVVREKLKSKRRSPQWDEIRDKFVEKNPTCAACGSEKKLQVHHIQPFHLRPELELSEENLIVLCMDVNECHLKIGHGGSFRCYNPRVVVQALRFLVEKEPGARQYIVEVCKMIREKT